MTETTSTPIGAAFASRNTVASLAAKFLDLHERERAKWARREELEQRTTIARLDNDEEAVARFQAASAEVKDWHDLYIGKKAVAADLCTALGIDPATLKSAL